MTVSDFFDTCPPHLSFEVLPLPLHFSTTPSLSFSSLTSLYLPPCPPHPPPLPIPFIPSALTCFGPTTDAGTLSFTRFSEECFKLAAGSGVQSSGSQLLTHTAFRVSTEDVCAKHTHTHNTFMKQVSTTETLNRRTPSQHTHHLLCR